MPPLSERTLEALPQAVERPRYDRGALTVGIVPLGVGAFHRAHQAAYTDALLGREPGWGILGASLKSSASRDALKPQDCLYTLAVRSGEGERLKVIGGI